MMIGHCILIMAFLSDFHVTYKKNEVKKEDGKKFLNAMDSWLLVEIWLLAWSAPFLTS